MILNPLKNTISGNYYATIIKSELLSAIKRKCQQLQRSRVLLHYDNMSSHNSRVVGAQWLSGRVLDSRPKGRGFEPHRRHCVVVLEQDTFILA